jgi:hypothetical protein
MGYTGARDLDMRIKGSTRESRLNVWWIVVAAAISRESAAPLLDF